MTFLSEAQTILIAAHKVSRALEKLDKCPLCGDGDGHDAHCEAGQLKARLKEARLRK